MVTYLAKKLRLFREHINKISRIFQEEIAENKLVAVKFGTSTIKQIECTTFLINYFAL